MVLGESDQAFLVERLGRCKVILVALAFVSRSNPAMEQHTRDVRWSDLIRSEPHPSLLGRGLNPTLVAQPKLMHLTRDFIYE